MAILNTTMEVANAISKDIANVAVETEHLKDAIGATSRSMNELSSGANEVSVATEEQAASTARIGRYIQKVDASTQEILNDSVDAQEKLEKGRICFWKAAGVKMNIFRLRLKTSKKYITVPRALSARLLPLPRK